MQVFWMLDAALTLKSSVHTLGLLLDVQVVAMDRSAYYQLRLIYQLHPFRYKKNLANITYVLITSRLDYCNAFYVGLPFDPYTPY